MGVVREKEFVIETLKNYNKLEERAETVFNLLGMKKVSRESVSEISFSENIENGLVYITTSYTCWNETIEEDYRFPIEYLWKDNAEIIAEIQKKKQEEKEILQKQVEEQKRNEEKRDREEYERLKKKYEKS